jgi:hypothetical protein
VMDLRRDQDFLLAGRVIDYPGIDGLDVFVPVGCICWSLILLQ